MQFDVDVQGLAAVERKLRLLPDRLGNNAMRRALRKGARIVHFNGHRKPWRMRNVEWIRGALDA